MGFGGSYNARGLRRLKWAAPKARRRQGSQRTLRSSPSRNPSRNPRRVEKASACHVIERRHRRCEGTDAATGASASNALPSRSQQIEATSIRRAAPVATVPPNSSSSSHHDDSSCPPRMCVGGTLFCFGSKVRNKSGQRSSAVGDGRREEETWLSISSVRGDGRRRARERGRQTRTWPT